MMITLTDKPMNVFAPDLMVDDWVLLGETYYRVLRIENLLPDNEDLVSGINVFIAPIDLVTGSQGDDYRWELTSADSVPVYNQRG